MYHSTYYSHSCSDECECGESLCIGFFFHGQCGFYNNMVYNLIIHLVIGAVVGVHLQFNYNFSLVHEQALFSEPLLLAPRHPGVAQRPPLIEQFPLRKYELKDTGYHIDDSSLSQVDHQLLYHMEPPAGVFAFQVLSVENYHLLEIRQFQVAISNPSPKFTLCVNEIVVDSEQVRRNDDRGSLPLCLNPGAQQYFNFSLYVSAPQPSLVRVTVYFLVEIMDGRQSVEEKAYARKIYATVAQNHLRLQTVHFKNCPAQQTITLHNYQPHQLAIRLQSRRRMQSVNGDPLQGEIKLRIGKEVQLQMEGKATQLIIHSHGGQGKLFPSLLFKTHCQEHLTIDYQNIGILADERMVLDIPLTVTSRVNQNLTLLEIQLEASSQTVELQLRQELSAILSPFTKNCPIAMMRIHSSKHPQRRSTITVRVRYQQGGQQKVAIQRFVYVQIRNAVSAGQRKNIDVTKYASGRSESRFPIKNNLNVPIYLNRIIVDESIFQLNWQSDRRRLIYPNHSSEQFSLIYTGSLNLPLSSIKYLALLQFNGHILVPLQITIYDHTLQCLYNNIVHKCAALPPLDFGYFRDSASKSKQLVVRNWNPESKVLQIGINQQQALRKGYNVSMRVYRPNSDGDNEIKQHKAPLQVMLKSQQFILLQIEVSPFDNATSTSLNIQLATVNEVVSAQLIVRTENGTIALIPQVLRFSNAISRQIQYINLVSTYSQQYSIREVTTNLTGLSVHYNQPPIILGNEWVGMSVVYDPISVTAFSKNITNSLLQQQYFKHRKNYEYQPAKYARIRLTTTTDLQANSTVIVQQKFPHLIPQGQMSSEIQGVFQIRKVMLKRKRKSAKKEQRHSGQIKITISNTLDIPISYSLHILSQPKIRDVDKTLKNFELYSSDQMEEGYMCISEELRNKWGITAGTIKSVFRLPKLPQECTIQKNNAETYVIDSQKRKVHVGGNLTWLYLSKSLRNNCRICFRFSHKYYIHRLINTQLVNKVLQEEGLPFFTDFVKAELNHMEDIQLFQLEYLDFHSRIKEDFIKFCETYPDVMMFRFCHYTNTRISSITDHTRTKYPLEKQIVVRPGHSHIASLAIAYPPGRERAEFYLVAANNLTHFETYRITVALQEPSLRAQPIFSLLQSDNANREEFINRRRPSELPIRLTRGDYRQEEGVLTGSRTFELVNDGEIQIEVVHVGIDQKQVACALGDIWLTGLTCRENPRASDWSARAPRQPALNRSQQSESFVITAHSSRNFTINFQFVMPRQQMLRTPYFPLYPETFSYNIYLYDSKGYYYRLTAVFRVGDPDLRKFLQRLQTGSMRQPLVKYNILNFISVLLISIILVRVSREQNSKRRQGYQQTDPDLYRLYRGKKLSRIVRESTYSDTDSSIGMRLVKRAPQKPVHCISEDLLLSVREVKQRELKKYFNQSEQSEIGGLVGYNHHLSLSHSMSYEQQEHDNNQQHGQMIQLNSPRIDEEESHDHMHIEHQHQLTQSPTHSDGQESDESQETEHDKQSSSSELPEGEEVKCKDELDADSSWFDFNQENSWTGLKSVHSVLEDQNEFYNVFRSQIKLKKQPDNNYGRYQHHKRD